MTRCLVRGGDNFTTFGPQAVSLTCGSRGEVVDCLLHRSAGGGVACVASALVFRRNLVTDCATRLCSPVALADLLMKKGDEVGNGRKMEKEEPLGVCTAISVKETSDKKVSLTDNLILRCDVGLNAGKDSSPAVRGNQFEGSFFSGVYAECGARPNVVDNTFSARSAVPAGGGLGVLMLLGSRGMVGRNSFSGYDLAPIMCFGSCRPLLTANMFDGVIVDRTKQEAMEARMKASFRRELFEAEEDARFYIVDSEEEERQLRDVILKGN